MLDFASLTKYLLEGLAIAVAAFYIPQKKADLKEIVMIALTGAAVFAVLDLFAPSVSAGARQGAGFGIGWNMVGGADDKAPVQTESTETSTTDSTEKTETTTATSETASTASGESKMEATHEPFVSQPAPLV